MLSLNLYKNGFYDRSDLFWRLALSAGLSGFQIGHPSQVLGIVLMVELFYLVVPFQFFLFPRFTVFPYVSVHLALLGDFGLSLWLLIMGAKDNLNLPAQQ